MLNARGATLGKLQLRSVSKKEEKRKKERKKSKRVGNTGRHYWQYSTLTTETRQEMRGRVLSRDTYLHKPHSSKEGWEHERLTVGGHEILSQRFIP